MNTCLDTAPSPSRHTRLVCWRLVYHVDPIRDLTSEDENAACAHARLALEYWNALKVACPREWAKILGKRARRKAWLEAHGSIPEGWSPPDPNDRRTANKPIKAYLARHKMSVEWLKLILSEEFSSRQAAPNWIALNRVVRWLSVASEVPKGSAKTAP